LGEHLQAFKASPHGLDWDAPLTARGAAGYDQGVTIRRFFALALFLFSTYWLVLGVRLFRRVSGGYEALAGLIVSGSALVGILVAIVIASGHRTRSFAEDSGFGFIPHRAKSGIASGVIALAGSAMWFIALRGLARNRMNAVGLGSMDVTFGAAPGRFVACLAFWVIVGGACLGLARFLARSSRGE
jgi:hypothetical protein